MKFIIRRLTVTSIPMLIVLLAAVACGSKTESSSPQETPSQPETNNPPSRIVLTSEKGIALSLVRPPVGIELKYGLQEDICVEAKIVPAYYEKIYKQMKDDWKDKDGTVRPFECNRDQYFKGYAAKVYNDRAESKFTYFFSANDLDRFAHSYSTSCLVPEETTPEKSCLQFNLFPPFYKEDLDLLKKICSSNKGIYQTSSCNENQYMFFQNVNNETSYPNYLKIELYIERN